MTGNILIVDDDAKVLDIVAQSLASKGHSVRKAAGGREALTTCETDIPDVVLLDLMLPDMDGRDVLRAIRARPGGRTVPVLFLSANADPDTRVNAIDEGAEDFLVKPFSLKELNAKIERVLHRKGTSREWEAEKTVLKNRIDVQEKNTAVINRELKRQILSMKTLFAASQDLNSRLDVEDLINGLSLSLMGELQISSMAFFQQEKEGNCHLALHDLKGFDRRRIEGLRIPVESELVRWASEAPNPRKIARNGEAGWVKRLPDIRLAVFEYVMPIVVRQELRGLVFTGPKLNGREYKPFELDLLASLCNSAGTAMEHARLFQRLEDTYLSTIKALMSIVEAKDAYTKGHTERVADYSVALGKKMTLGRNELRDLAFAAVLHDIGKLVVYENVLKKPGSLDDEEWRILKSHPAIGASIIENMEFLGGAVPLVRHHHERYDGEGYPDGLKAESIPLGARIIAVADSYDAMTTDRPYRKALTREIALHTMIAKAGTQFDAGVVEHFIDLLEKDGFQPRQSCGASKPELL